MILSFKTHIGKKPTLFTNKIAKFCWQKYGKEFSKLASEIETPNYYVYHPLSMMQTEMIKPKLTTIRRDSAKRWKAGVMIDFFIYPRTKKMFRFAPRIPVVSTQDISIEWVNDTDVFVWVDGTAINSHKVKELAINDGFDSVENFFEWFNADFKGKIIHWTDLKY